MRRTAMIVATAFVTFGATVLTAAPALAHGYVSSPPSRQAMCAQGRVTGCGPIVYEPQSVEGPKGQRNCHGGVARFAQLSDESKAWPATPVGTGVTFNWVLTARHATSTWEYYIGNTRIATFNDGGRQPGATVSHAVNLAGFSGRQKVLAIWNIADTANAFYACIDLQIGGGGTTPTPTPTPTPTQSPTPTPTPTVTPGGTWKAGTAYTAGSQVTYGGATYRCLQAHTAIAGWEPPNVPALWQRV
ncbi:lytic polysaccharide monooxygenase [Planomonospora sp. ID91781]|uniref:Cellulose-binding protein n=3 Tax=Planomonospora TaxID=1998 RepID=A0A171CWJ6_9ACTN|nr:MULTISPECIES: lytic polysaccharide monooxygenase [Planomonospora]MBG0823635.1 lytic polysaccharide monooxygenase [Planomonospora sp. ID91781]GAT67331.1 cellulose-binding protein [Planomonospora sphaerica]GGK95506.1 cellulose-binding protein [Planomonospora parontospora]GII12592.1 cellulose-binding protein [Planomonospora parontospora subsp. parontospora]